MHTRTSSPGKSYLETMVGSVAMIALNLATGVLTARLLEPHGRGAVGAIAGWVVMLAFMGGLGFRDGLSYAESRDPRRSADLLSLAIVSSLVLGVATVAVAELLIPIGFSAQSDEVVRFARIFMLWILPYIAYNTFGSLLASRHRFRMLNAQRVAQPLVYVILLALLWMADAVTVGWVLAANMLSFVIPGVAAFAVLVADSGLGSLRRPLAREAAAYGLRAHGNNIGQLFNVRLDVMVMPAVLAAEEIGFYVVAVSAASMVSGVFGSLQMAVFPLAARLGHEEATDLVVRTMRLILAASIVVSIVLGVGAPLLVELLYGHEFLHGVTALRLLLPGIVMWSASSAVVGGLKALGRPQDASVAQLVGAVITVIGLVLTLRPFGIEGAAVTSSIAYTVVFALALRALGRVSHEPLSHVLDLRSAGDDMRWLAASMGSGGAR